MKKSNITLVFIVAVLLLKLPYSIAQTNAFKMPQTPTQSANQLVNQPTNSSNTNIGNIRTLIQDQDLFSIKMNSSSVDSSHLEAQYKYQAQRGLQTSGVSFIAGIYPETDFSYLAMPVAYYSNTQKWTTVQLDYTFGRKLTVQNYLDSHFDLGLINPYFTQDHINYTEQGLIGLHTSLANNYLKMGLNYYPLFIPNQGPLVREKNGKISGANRWAQEAPETFLYNEKENTITYSIDDYNLYDLMENSGYSALFQAGDIEKHNIEWNLTYSYTPINDIVLSRTVIADLNLNGSVKVYPVVRYSDKITSDFKWRKHNVTFIGSYLLDSPHNQLESDDRAVQVMESIYGYGGGIEIDLHDFTDHNVTVGASYGRFFGGEMVDKDSDGKTNAFNISNQRLIFQQPYRFNFGADAFRLFNQVVHTDISWTYDGLQRGSLLSFTASHRPIPRMNVALGFDVIGLTDDIDSENKKTFLGKHSADDRVTGAIEYVF